MPKSRHVSLDVAASPICLDFLKPTVNDIGCNYGYVLVVILLDECGDMGRSPGSSRNFLVAAMAVHDPNELVRLLKNARKKLGKRGWEGEIKFHSSTDLIRKFILEGIAKLDCQIAWASYEKSRLPLTLQTNKHLLYLTACEMVLRELFRRHLDKKVLRHNGQILF